MHLTPSRFCNIGRQSTAHPPQLPTSFVVSTQTLLQFVSPLHVEAHVLPLQYSVPPVGAAGQAAVQEVPQVFDSEGAWQSPAQSILPGPQVQALFWQNSVPLQLVAQLLQCFALLVVSMHSVPQSVGVADPQAMAHVVPLHDAMPVPAVGPGHAGLQRPPAPHPFSGPGA